MAITEGVETRINTFTTGDQWQQQVTLLPGAGWLATWISDGQDGSGEGVYQQAYDATGATVGSETAVNTYTTGYQYHQKVIPLKEGGWIVVWESGGTPGQDGSSGGIYQQRFDVNGAAVGVETRVNTFTTGTQSEPEVAALPDGGWVVIWKSNDQEITGFGLYQQRYDVDGDPVGGEARATADVVAMQTPKITALSDADGGWLVSWVQSDSSGDGVYFRRFDDTGASVTGDVQANTFTTGSQSLQKVTLLDGGGWVVTWTSANQDWGGNGVYQQSYSATGIAQGSETLVNTTTTSNQNGQEVAALADGGWVVTWMSFGQDATATWGIYQQTFNADGTARGSETQVNTVTAGNQTSPQVAALSGGGWVVTWQSEGQDGSSAGIYQRVFKADGTALSTEIQVNTETDDNQASQTVTALADESWMVAWRSKAQDGSGWGVYQKLFDLSGQAPTDIALGGPRTVAEGASQGTVIGALSTTDADAGPGDTPVFTIVYPDGRFAVAGANLVVANGALIDFEAAAAHTVRVKVTDVDGMTFEKDIVVSVADRREGDTTSGDDRISGTAGAERFDGGLGNDTLTGKGAADTFAFDTKLHKTKNVDHITDFAVGIDKIELDRSVFKKLKAGELNAKAFTDGKVKADDRIVYNKTTGEIAYDSDGKGGAKPIKFAILDGSPDTLSAKDFVVVA